jgi:hypothetical protein
LHGGPAAADVCALLTLAAADVRITASALITSSLRARLICPSAFPTLPPAPKGHFVSLRRKRLT